MVYGNKYIYVHEREKVTGHFSVESVSHDQLNISMRVSACGKDELHICSILSTDFDVYTSIPISVANSLASR